MPLSEKEFFNSEFLSSLGVVDWGYTHKLSPLSYGEYLNWISLGHQGTLSYLSDERKEARKTLKSVLPHCESAVSFLFSYSFEKSLLASCLQREDYNGLKVASYVTSFKGRDYHRELGERLEKLGLFLQGKIPGLEYGIALDVHPILERDLAYRCGLGWFGKNSMLISKKYGSFTLIGSLLLNKRISYFEVEREKLETDHCGNCRRCLDACPTEAILEGQRKLEASRCISTFTIEHFKETPAPVGMELAHGEIFGCDICQDICPWNVRLIGGNTLQKRSEEKFEKENSLLLNFFLKRPRDQVLLGLESLSNRSFFKSFKETPLGRTGRRGLLKNLKFWEKLR